MLPLTEQVQQYATALRWRCGTTRYHANLILKFGNAHFLLPDDILYLQTELVLKLSHRLNLNRFLFQFNP